MHQGRYLDTDNSFSSISSCFRVREISASAADRSFFSCSSSDIRASSVSRSLVVAAEEAAVEVGAWDELDGMLLTYWREERNCQCLASADNDIRVTTNHYRSYRGPH